MYMIDEFYKIKRILSLDLLLKGTYNLVMKQVTRNKKYISISKGEHCYGT